MICERCGRDMQDNTTICPFCGTLTDEVRKNIQPSTSYGKYTQGTFGEPSPYERGYMPQAHAVPPAPPPPRQGYQPPPQQNYSYGTPPSPPPQPQYQQGQVYTPPITITVVNNTNKDGALIAEILFSLFGIFGVGWLIGGETTTGVILLVCSFLVYWPIIFGGTLFTFGFGLICLGPLAVAAIIVNAILLSQKLNRKAQQPYVVVQQPPPMSPMPPMHMPPPRPQ